MKIFGLPKKAWATLVARDTNLASVRLRVETLVPDVLNHHKMLLLFAVV